MPKESRDGPDQRQLRRLALRGDESVVLVVRPSRWLSLPKYLVTLGLYGIWRKRHTYILTDQRILLGKGVFTRTERSTPISQIEDATFVRRWIGAHCEVTARSRERLRTFTVGPLSSRSARRFTTEIQHRI